MRLGEINARLAEIETELETASGDALDALECEAAALIEERDGIIAENERKQQLRSRVASGAVGVPMPGIPSGADTPETVEEREARMFTEYIFNASQEMRTSTPQNFSAGNNGAIIPATIAARIIDEVKNICPILREADVYHVKGTLKIPVYGNSTDSDSNSHNITVGYSAEFSELTPDAGAFTSVDLGGYLIRALTLVGKSLQNNAGFNVLDFVIGKMAESIAAFVEGELLTGSGAANGHCTGALSTTNTLLAGSTSAISADKLIELQAKVKQAYQENSCWTMHPNTFVTVKKLKYADGRYIVSESYNEEFPFRLLGKPVRLSDNMPQISSAAKPILYGNYKGLAVNIRDDISVEVLRERYADLHALGVYSFMELDSKVANPQMLAALVMSAE